MSFIARLHPAIALVCAGILPLMAAEKKDEKKKPEPPSVSMVLPLAITPGATNKIKIRGQNLTNVTEVKFAQTNFQPEITIKSKGKAEVPKEMDVKKVGDTQIEAEIRLPENAPLGTSPFTLVSPVGESKPAAFVVVSAKALLPEKESNNSFREAQPLELGKTVQGVVSEAKDVDVFKLNCKAGQNLMVQVQAARLGSTLDSILTLYDDHGHQIAASDDSDSDADSVLQVRIPKDGTYLLSLMDAHDKGGSTYVYLLTVQEK